MGILLSFKMNGEGRKYHPVYILIHQVDTSVQSPLTFPTRVGWRWLQPPGTFELHLGVIVDMEAESDSLGRGYLFWFIRRHFLPRALKRRPGSLTGGSQAQRVRSVCNS